MEIIKSKINDEVIITLEQTPSNESIRFDAFVMPLIKSVQELSQQNDDLKKRIEALEAK